MNSINDNARPSERAMAAASAKRERVAKMKRQQIMHMIPRNRLLSLAYDFGVTKPHLMSSPELRMRLLALWETPELKANMTRYIVLNVESMIR